MTLVIHLLVQGEGLGVEDTQQGVELGVEDTQRGVELEPLAEVAGKWTKIMLTCMNICRINIIACTNSAFLSCTLLPSPTLVLT